MFACRLAEVAIAQRAFGVFHRSLRSLQLTRSLHAELLQATAQSIKSLAEVALALTEGARCLLALALLLASTTLAVLAARTLTLLSLPLSVLALLPRPPTLLLALLLALALLAS